MSQAVSFRSQVDAGLRQKAGLRVAVLSGRQALQCLTLAAVSFTALISLTSVSNAQSTKHFCLVERISDGSIQPNIQNRALTSKRFGGFAGRMKVTTTRGRYRLVVDDPLGFSYSPPNGGDNVRFKTSFSGSGATNFSDRPGNESIRLKRGVTFIETHLVARKLNRKTFPAGNYNATLTLRCE